jgi:NAD(P)-dependent dehydrogenase (short-subunit alcohol dehydrogenase family)
MGPQYHHFTRSSREKPATILPLPYKRRTLNLRLENKVAIITGGGRGIGRALALGYSREGAKILVASRTAAEVRSVAEDVIEAGGEAASIVCDVSDEDQVKAMVAHALDHFGKVDILVNNAGVSSLRPVWGIPKKTFERVLGVNLIGTFLCTKHVWKPMRDGGGGSILNISSLGGMEGYPLLSAYCASKWGQIGFTVASAEEGKADNIRINAVAPGKADTAFRAQLLEDKSRMLTAEDHVGVCIFLASDEARFITGRTIPIDWFGPVENKPSRSVSGKRKNE